MKVLIAGGAGDVGRYLAHDFLSMGHQVKILDRAANAFKAEKNLPIGYVQGDLADQAIVNEAVRDSEVVINLAWSFADDPHTIFSEDVQGHINLMEAASPSGIKHFIYTSTATVYGRAISHPVTETHPCLTEEARKPLYALGKWTAEELCRYYYKERGLPVTIFHFWWAFGENIGGSHLRDLIRKSFNHQPLEMVRGAGGTFLTMADLGNAVISAIKHPSSSGQVYNLGSLFLTWEEIGKMMVELTHSNSTIHLVASDEWQGPAFLNEVWDLSREKAERELGYKPKDTLESMRSLFLHALRSCIRQISPAHH